MNKGQRIGIYINHTHLGNGEYVVTNTESLSFVKQLRLAKDFALAVSVLHKPNIEPNDYTIALKEKKNYILKLPGWKNTANSIPALLFSFRKILKKAQSFVNDNDIIWLRVPSLVALFFWYSAKKKRKPLIIHVVGNPLLAPLRSNYRGLQKPMARCFSYILYISLKIMTRYGVMVTAGGELKEMLSNSIHSAYQLDDILIYQKDLKPPKKTRARAKNLLFVGRFDYGKGIEVLINAVGQLSKELPDIHLKLAGSGPLLEAMKKRVSDKKLQDNVEFLGFISSTDTLNALYRKADILVLPSDGYPEGFPRVILETWAAGLPLIATRLAGIPYRVKDGKNGLLVTPGSVDELTVALRKLIADRNLRHRIAQGGYQTVKNLTFDHQAALVRNLLNDRFSQ